jgi:dual-specificity kinase
MDWAGNTQRCPHFFLTFDHNHLSPMQAVHALPPQMLPQYHRQPPNGVVISANNANGSTFLPTPVPSTRKRKRTQYTVSYSEVQEVDPEGKTREVIVIEDTPPPPPTVSPGSTIAGGFSASYPPPPFSAPIRTRARAAAEAQGLNTPLAIVSPALKKRKKDPTDEGRAPPAKKAAAVAQHPHVLPGTDGSWGNVSSATADDVCP